MTADYSQEVIMADQIAPLLIICRIILAFTTDKACLCSCF